MRYLGGKSRLAKHIGKVIVEYTDNSHVAYREPFCGSASVVEWLAKNGYQLPMFLYDAAPDLIELYQDLQRGWTPPSDVSEEFYNFLKEQPYHSALRGFVGYGCSWGGKFFGGYARGENRNYADESKRSLLKTISHLSAATFSLASYQDLDYREWDRSIIYCDPPYKGTTSYEAVQEFDSNEFWQIMREWSQLHTVIISEYDAPDDFRCIWEKGHSTSIRPKDGNEVRQEKLFVYSN